MRKRCTRPACWRSCPTETARLRCRRRVDADHVASPGQLILCGHRDWLVASIRVHKHERARLEVVSRWSLSQRRRRIVDGDVPDANSPVPITPHQSPQLIFSPVAGNPQPNVTTANTLQMVGRRPVNGIQVRVLREILLLPANLINAPSTDQQPWRIA